MRRRRAAGVVVAALAASLAAANVASCGLDVLGGGPTTDSGQPDTYKPEASLPPEGGPNPDGATDGDAASACPTGRGPAMILVSLPDASPFCIDSTEVTNAQYDDFYASFDGGRVPEGGLDAGPQCTLAAMITKRTDAGGALPVEGVSWCDAYAFCRWAGRRLCQPLEDGGAPADTEWGFACSGGGQHLYAYGDAYAPVCNDSIRMTGPVPVASQPACEGGVPGLFDMSGNVAEYVAFCANAASCDYVGGYYSSLPGEVTCRSRFPQNPTAPTLGIGFRCCAPPN